MIANIFKLIEPIFRISVKIGDTVIPKIIPVIEKIGEAVSTIMGFVVDVLGTVVQGISEIVKAIAPVVTDVIKTSVEAIKSIVEGIGTAIGWIREKITAMFGFFADMGPRLWNGVKSKLAPVADFKVFGFRPFGFLKGGSGDKDAGDLKVDGASEKANETIADLTKQLNTA